MSPASKWPGKFVIGLTGNIGTGKSVVRRMLEHLGAYGIDADMLAHRAISKGAPGHARVVECFGRWVLAADGEVDRARLGKIVFSDPLALQELEKIVHPLVEQAVDAMVRRSTHSVITIEAIKLLESGLAAACDSLWVTTAPLYIQVERLVKQRGMSEADARQRIQAQPPQELKIDAAHVVIQNTRSFEDTWRQVAQAWEKCVPSADVSPATIIGQVRRPQGELRVLRGKPRHSAEIAAFLSRLRGLNAPLTQEDIMAGFGEQAYLLLQNGPSLLGVMGWQVENLVARTLDIALDASVPPVEALSILIPEMERAAQDLQAEASLVFVRPELAELDGVWTTLGYESRSAQALGIQAWQEAANESALPGTRLLFKQLRQERILRPI